MVYPPRTVEVHKANLMKKLGARSKGELASKIIVINPMAAAQQNHSSRATPEKLLK
ncbi:MAG: LuxR C-terminal-related transcriptional regulator [Moraxella osloensis]